MDSGGAYNGEMDSPPTGLEILSDLSPGWRPTPPTNDRVLLGLSVSPRTGLREAHSLITHQTQGFLLVDTPSG